MREEHKVSAAAALEIRMLGTFEVRVQGQPLRRLRTRKGELLLALLVLRHDRETDRVWLAETLWPDSAPEQAAYNLRRSLTDLRQALGPAASHLRSSSPHSLRLDLSGTDCDLLAFDAATATGTDEAGHPQGASLRRAVNLYRGPLLEGYDETWLLEEREARAGRFLTMLETLADRATARGDRTEAIRYLQRAIMMDPFRETAQQRLLRAQSETGDLAGAKRTYREFRLLLHRELHTDPSPETLALYQQILERRPEQERTPASPATSSLPTLSQTARSRLPHPLSRLIGRAQEIETVVDYLTSARLVTLTGAGGVGKTRLAIAAAETVTDDYPDGICFVDLTPISDSTLLPSTLAALFQLREEPGRSLIEMLQDFLLPRTLLLLLDNCEHLIEACAHLTEALLLTCPRLRVLATSREPLRISGERLFRVPSLDVPPPEITFSQDKNALALLLEYEAPRLFVERVQWSNADLHLSPIQADTLARICLQLDGIPLAIELAAAQMQALSVEEISRHLEDRLGLLRGGSRTLPRQETLRATLDWSYSLLSEEEQALLQELSVFSGGHTLEAAEQVCGRGAEIETATRGVAALLARLMEKSLLVYEVQPDGTGRYRLLETTRQYASEKRRQSVWDRSAQVRHCNYFLVLAEAARPHLNVGGEEKSWLERLDAEHDNIRAALNFCCTDADGATMGLRLAVAMSKFWEIYGYLTEGRACLAAVLLRREAPEERWRRGEALNALAGLARMQGDYMTARNSLAESLEIARELGSKRGIALSLGNLGLLAKEQGDYAMADAYLKEGLVICREEGNRHGIAHCLNNLGIVAYDQHDYASAQACYSECLTLYREADDRRGIAMSLSNLGLVSKEQGDLIAARTWNEESLQLCREIGEKYGAASCLNNLGLIACGQKDYAASRAFYAESLAIKRELGDRRGIAMTLSNLGLLATEQEDYDTARSCFIESLRICWELGEKYGISEVFTGLSLLATAQGQWRRAIVLRAAVVAVRDDVRASLSSKERLNMDRDLTYLRTAVGDAAFATAWAEGRAMSLEEAAACAMQEPPDL